MESEIRRQQAELADLIDRKVLHDGVVSTEITGISLVRVSEVTDWYRGVHEPALCITAQGKKRVTLAEETFVYGPDDCLVVSADLPIAGGVLEATPSRPYLCIRVDLDPAQLASIMVEAKLGMPDNRAPSTGFALCAVTSEVLDAAIRLVKLLESPRDTEVLAPMVVRELLYRLLILESSGRLREIALSQHRLQSVNLAIRWLKIHFAAPFHIETLAREACMSVSALHHHFKTVTGLSPLQYQKQLRLQEARRLMLGHALDAASASFQVGYVSPSQFSREYSRHFGAPPTRDIARLRESTFDPQYAG